MTDTRLPENFLTDPRIDNLSDAAFRVYVNGEVYSVSTGTDGALTARGLRFLHPEGSDQAIVRELVDAGLWHPTSHGWDIADFLLRQTPAAVVRKLRDEAKESRAKAAERKRRQRRAAAEAAGQPDVPLDVPRDVLVDEVSDFQGQRQDSDSDRTGFNGGTTQLRDSPESRPHRSAYAASNGEYRGGAVDQW
jgi:hypothetical protein